MNQSAGTGKWGAKFLQRPIVETIVKAVLTGIFILSLFLNLLFILIIAIGGILAGGGARGYTPEGYRKVYTDSGFPVIKARRVEEIAVIRIDGVITEESYRGGLFGYQENLLSGVKKRLNIIKKDPGIRGVILVIDSPGGSVTASDVLYQTIWKFKEETHLPVVTLMKEVAASGGYYVAAASDYIVAYPTTITGSIGVIMYNFNIKKLLDRFGVEYIAIKTGEHKDAVSPFKPVDRREVAWMQSIADAMLEQFIEAVDRGRENLTAKDVRKLANGQVFIARDALERGLIDEIGYFEDAIRVVSERAGLSAPVTVEFEQRWSLRNLIGRAMTIVPESFFRRTLIEEMEMGIQSGRENPFYFYYLWEGGIYQYR